MNDLSGQEMVDLDGFPIHKGYHISEERLQKLFLLFTYYRKSLCALSAFVVK